MISGRCVSGIPAPRRPRVGARTRIERPAPGSRPAVASRSERPDIPGPPAAVGRREGSGQALAGDLIRLGGGTMAAWRYPLPTQVDCFRPAAYTDAASI